LDPKLAEATTSLGILLAMKGQLDSAIEQYRRAIEVKLELMLAHFHLSLSLLRRAAGQTAFPVRDPAGPAVSRGPPVPEGIGKPPAGVAGVRFGAVAVS
jgi:hypothetical protein